MNQGAFLMRGLEKVRAEFSLTARDPRSRPWRSSHAFQEAIGAISARNARKAPTRTLSRPPARGGAAYANLKSAETKLDKWTSLRVIESVAPSLITTSDPSWAIELESAA